MKVNLKGKTALVSGATSGIGKSIAFRFAENGCNLVLTARTEANLKRIKQELENSFNVNIDYISTDFDYPMELKEKVSSFYASFSSPIHILVNCVRGPLPVDINNITPEHLTNTFNRHVVSSQILTNIFLPDMRKEKNCRILNVIDTIFKNPYPGLGLSVVRGAEASWIKALALDVISDEITVNCILPGPTDTPGLIEILKILAINNGVSYDKFKNEVISNTPIKRFATSEEIANVALFLVSPEASYVTGTFLNVDGGFSPSM